MKLTFAGVGSAFTDSRYWQSNMFFTSKQGKRLMIDCGGDARFSFGEHGANNRNIGEWSDGVYISHLHADHIGGLEWYAFCTYFNPNAPRPKLFIVDELVDPLWESLKGGLASLEGKVMTLEDFFDVRELHINGSFVWEELNFTPIQTVHIMNGMGIVPSYGLLVKENGNSETAFITTDTQFCPRQIERFYERSSIIFHDAETGARRSGIHAYYDDLKTLDASHKSKMWLYHYNPEPTQNAEEDGFKGFVKKGQSFEI